MKNIQGLKESVQLAKFLGIKITNLKSYNQYIDKEFFFDHILELDDSYVNFCKITPANKARYLLLLELNKLDSKYFIPSDAIIFNYNNTEWFYEKIIKHPIIELTTVDLKIFWNNLESLSKEIQRLSIDNSIIKQNNEFFKQLSYYHDINYLFPNLFLMHNKQLKSLYVNYVDIEKAFELGRIVRENGYFKVTGLQAFLPCPFEYAKCVSTILSSFNESEILGKLKLLNSGNELIKIIDAIRDQTKAHPEYFKIDINKLLGHLEAVEVKWKELQ